MSEIKLFHLNDGPTPTAPTASEIPGSASGLEKPLQTLFEHNLETLLGVRFLASEHTTGTVHGGRIDTLGIDENGSPVIIEYKRAIDDNVISQGLFYLDWLVSNKRVFGRLVEEKFGANEAESIVWRSPRLICIAAEFTKYDRRAVRQIRRQISLVRYKHFGSNQICLDFLSSPGSIRRPSPPSSDSAAKSVPAEVNQDPLTPGLRSARLPKTASVSAIRQFCVGLKGASERTVESGFWYFVEKQVFCIVSTAGERVRVRVPLTASRTTREALEKANNGGGAILSKGGWTEATLTPGRPMASITPLIEISHTSVAAESTD